MKIWLIILLSPLSLLATPNAPTDLILTPSHNAVHLTWQDNANNETGFKIYRNGILIQQVEAGVTHYHDSKLVPKIRYTYTVHATDDIAIDDAAYTFTLEHYLSDALDNIGMWIPNKNDLIDTFPINSFYESAEGLNIQHSITATKDGFDVDYTIINHGAEKTLPILKIPGILFRTEDNTNNENLSTLHILNPYFKHYLETRDIIEEESYHDSDSDETHTNYFSVGNIVRTIDGVTYEHHEAYGVQFVYAPVIVATDGTIAVGASLNINHAKKEERLHPLMGIKKEGAHWTYLYDLRKDHIKAHSNLKLTISVRFATHEKWISTLYPYKNFFNNNLKGEKRTPIVKDLRPIQGITFAYGNRTEGTRHWAWAFAGNDDTVFPLYDVVTNMASILKQKGYKRATLWNFTGLYDGNETTIGYHDKILQTQLPFQFVSSHPDILPEYMKTAMQQILSDDNLTLQLGYDWGISGSIPTKNGEVLGLNAWQPDDIVDFDYNNPSHENYAQHYLDEAKKLEGVFKAKFIRLDAFQRMDVNGRVQWLKHLQASLPDTTIATESNLDFMHARTTSIMQPDAVLKWKGVGTKEEHSFTQADLLGHYLNPGAETVVWLSNSVVELRPSALERESYIQSLTAMGYTPLIDYHDEELGVQEYNTSAIIDITHAPTTVPQCMDNIDNNNDGIVDWPYDSHCSSPQDISEF